MQSSNDRVTVRIKREDPANGKPPWWQTYEVPRDRAYRVLDVLEYITDHLDPTLAFRPHVCRDLCCRVCWLRVNGKARMACSTPLPNAKEVTLEPCTDYALIRDLVVDFSHKLESSAASPEANPAPAAETV